MKGEARMERPEGAGERDPDDLPDARIRFLRPLGVSVMGMHLNECTGGLILRSGGARQWLDAEGKAVVDPP